MSAANDPKYDTDITNNEVSNPKTNERTTANAPVIFTTEKTTSGHYLGIMTLNSPKSLNALSVEMCQLLSQQLEQWQTQPEVVAILLKGAGDKAFCAGGDIRKLYDSMGIDAPMPNPYATEFFGDEYKLYRQMHFYPKPLILWGDGIIMGGGMGLMAACSHRIVTERTRFAMPEITIGLFPDASGSWFLQRMPAKIGLFLGLTGVHCNGNDALFTNLAEYSINSKDYDLLLQQLLASDWQAMFDSSYLIDAYSTVSRTLAKLPKSSLAQSKLATYWQPIQHLMNSGALADIDAVMQDDAKLVALNADFAQDPWVQRAIHTYRRGCPVTAALAFTLYNKVAQLSLEQILYLELNVAVHCAANPDFKEGVRALLIDKDKTPSWSRTLANCLTAEGQDYIEQHLQNPYQAGQHPLSTWLGDDALSAQYAR